MVGRLADPFVSGSNYNRQTGAWSASPGQYITGLGSTALSLFNPLMGRVARTAANGYYGQGPLASLLKRGGTPLAQGVATQPNLGMPQMGGTRDGYQPPQVMQTGGNNQPYSGNPFAYTAGNMPPMMPTDTPAIGQWGVNQFTGQPNRPGVGGGGGDRRNTSSRPVGSGLGYGGQIVSRAHSGVLSRNPYLQSF